MDVLATLPWKAKRGRPTIEKGEKMLLNSRCHWMKYFPAIFLYLLLLSLCLTLLGVSSVDIPMIRLSVFFGVLVALILIQHWFFHAMLSENVTDIILTNKRILLLSHRLWFSDTMEEIILSRIKMVEIRKRGIVRRVFNYGDLWFDTGGGQTVCFVPQPSLWVTQIERVMNIV